MVWRVLQKSPNFGMSSPSGSGGKVLSSNLNGWPNKLLRLNYVGVCFVLLDWGPFAFSCSLRFLVLQWTSTLSYLIFNWVCDFSLDFLLSYLFPSGLGCKFHDRGFNFYLLLLCFWPKVSQELKYGLGDFNLD